MTASIDLSSPFDLVNVNLIIKRLAIMGLPEDVIELIRIWLKERFLFYINVNDNNKIMNRMTIVNGLIKLKWLNKIKCYSLILT